MKVLFNDVAKQWEEIKDSCLPKVERFLASGNYISPEIISEFEQNFAEYTDSKYAIAVSNGTDALTLTLHTMKKLHNCCVVMAANNFISAAFAASHLGINIALIDCDEHYQMDTDLLHDWLNSNRDIYDQVILCITHLYGFPANMSLMRYYADAYKCELLEDCSQAHGAADQDGKVGSQADIAVYSCYPGKNLGACGQAGIVTTNIDEVNYFLRPLAYLGMRKKYQSIIIGYNSKPDALQCLILNEKLPYLNNWNDRRREIAELYKKGLKEIKHLVHNVENYYWWSEPVYHIFPIRLLVNDRDAFISSMSKYEIEVLIHYPIPIQKTIPYSYLNYGNLRTLKYADQLVSLPIHPYMTNEEVEYVIFTIKKSLGV